jgi:hypothetical protein
MKDKFELMTTVPLARTIRHCHNVSTIDDDITASIEIEGALEK